MTFVVHFAACAIALTIPALALADSDQPLALQADDQMYSDDCAAAIPLYERALTIEPRDGMSWLCYGYCLAQESRFPEAVTALRKATEFEEFAGEALYYMADVHRRAGDVQQAVDALEECWATGFELGFYLYADEDIWELAGDPRFDALIRDILFAGEPFEFGVTYPLTPELIGRGVEFVLREIDERHPNPYRYFDREQWVARGEEIIRKANELTESAYLTALMGLVSMAGDVHTSVYPAGECSAYSTSLPLRLWNFEDGLFIRAAPPQLRELLGMQVLRIGAFTTENDWDGLLARYPYENPSQAVYQAQFHLLFPDFLQANGWIDDEDSISFLLRSPDGEVREVMLSPTDQGYFPTMRTGLNFEAPADWIEAHDGASAIPLWLRHRDRRYWFEVLEQERALYLQVNVPRNDPSKPWDEFLDEAFDEIRRLSLTRLIIDLRHNAGGYHYLGRELSRHVVMIPTLSRPGGVFVLTARNTQSAGVSFAAFLERDTNALFVGEPVGAAPNFFNANMGFHEPLIVPGTNMFKLRISARQQQESDTLDSRFTIAPDVPIGMRYADYARGRDVVLRAALDVDEETARNFFRDPGGRPIPLYRHWRRPSQRAAFHRGQMPRKY